LFGFCIALNRHGYVQARAEEEVCIVGPKVEIEQITQMPPKTFNRVALLEWVP